MNGGRYSVPLRGVARAVCSLRNKFDAWFQPGEPVTYRDAWRYSLVFGLILLSYAAVQFTVGNPVWSAFLVLVAPTMAAFTLGFAVRRGTARQRLLSLGVGLAGGAGPFALPGVREGVLAVGPVGVLFVWLLVLIGLFGYAFPDYATTTDR